MNPSHFLKKHKLVRDFFNTLLDHELRNPFGSFTTIGAGWAVLDAKRITIGW